MWQSLTTWSSCYHAAKLFHFQKSCLWESSVLLSLLNLSLFICSFASPLGTHPFKVSLLPWRSQEFFEHVWFFIDDLPDIKEMPSAVRKRRSESWKRILLALTCIMTTEMLPLRRVSDIMTWSLFHKKMESGSYCISLVTFKKYAGQMCELYEWSASQSHPLILCCIIQHLHSDSWPSWFYISCFSWW